MPRQWLLITLYMVLVFCVGIAAIQYVKRHPIVDEGQQPAASGQLTGTEPAP